MTTREKAEARCRLDHRQGSTHRCAVTMATTLRRTAAAAAIALALAAAPGAQGMRPAGGADSIEVGALREWLTYIASDELQGRQVYTEGLGLAASYIADHLARWGVEPAAEDGSYFQTVRVLGVRANSRSTITITVGGESRTFRDGEDFDLPRNMGGAQTIQARRVRFLGYGVEPRTEGSSPGGDLQGTVAVWLGPAGPMDGAGTGRRLAARARTAIERGAVAAIGPPPPGRTLRAAAGTRAGGAPGPTAAPDFTTAQRYDLPVPPAVTAGDELLEFLFSASPVSFAELKAIADRQDPLPDVSLEGVSLTIAIEPDYTVVSTRLSRNVAGLVRGSDPAVNSTFVSVGAHYDHVGYRQAPPAAPGGGSFACPGQTRPVPRPDDIVYNGADDDGSGTVAVMAIARAFAQGPRPRRSVLFIWHTAEEVGLLGSRYNADFPIVPNEQIVAHLNMDMVGRNRCDDPGQADTLYLVGSDRISTELHNLSEETNAAMPAPLVLDYELNDPDDPQSLYTRSDHYSYAAKGIPVIFYTTGLHRDYHYLTDEVGKIEFDKLARIARLVFLTAERLAERDRPPARDHRGPRAGTGGGGWLEQ